MTLAGNVRSVATATALESVMTLKIQKPEMVRVIHEEREFSDRFVAHMLRRRKDRGLLRGNIWVDAETYLIHRIEGERAKSSSWWLKDMRIVLLYEYVEDMWLQTSSEGTANIRIVGLYKMISQDLSYKIDHPYSAGSSAHADFPPTRNVDHHSDRYAVRYSRGLTSSITMKHGVEDQG